VGAFVLEDYRSGAFCRYKYYFQHQGATNDWIYLFDPDRTNFLLPWFKHSYAISRQ